MKRFVNREISQFTFDKKIYTYKELIDANPKEKHFSTHEKLLESINTYITDFAQSSLKPFPFT